MGDLPFLDQEPTEEVVEEVKQVEAVPEPEESKGEEVAAPPAEVKEERHIPITALLDEREKRQAKEREADELRRRLAAYEQQQQQKPEFLDDPDAHIAALSRQAQALALQTKLDMSRAYAEDKFGKETVDAAFQFFNEHPQLSHPLVNHPMPFVEAVKVYQRHQAMQEIGDDPVAYRAKVEAEVRERLLAEKAKPATPPPSIATAPGVAGKSGSVGGFTALFGD